MREEDNLSKRLPSLGYTKAIPIGCVAHSRDVSGYDKAIFCSIVALGLRSRSRGSFTIIGLKGVGSSHAVPTLIKYLNK